VEKEPDQVAVHESVIPSGDPLAWNPKDFGEVGVTGPFQSADGVKVTEPEVPDGVPFQVPVRTTPLGRLTVTRHPAMSVVDVILT
jgi:hypothetical protein